MSCAYYCAWIVLRNLLLKNQTVFIIAQSSRSTSKQNSVSLRLHISCTFVAFSSALDASYHLKLGLSVELNGKALKNE